jgi:hypothetical protein
MAEERRYLRNPAIGATAIDDETFLVEPGTQEVYYLDTVTSALWRLLAEPRSEAELCALFAAAFPATSRETLGRDIARATADFVARGLAVIVGGAATDR